MSLRTILKQTSQCDILIASKEAELVNVLWLKPRSAFIEFLPPFSVDCYNFQMAQLARVFYVAVTRAKEKLIIIQPQTRLYYPYLF